MAGRAVAMQRQRELGNYRRRHRGRFLLTLGVLGGALATGIFCLMHPGSGSIFAGGTGGPGKDNPADAYTKLADWPLTLVSEAHPLPEDFTVRTEQVENNQRFDAQAVAQLRAMLADGRAAGMRLQVCSGYRSVNRQQQLYAEQVVTERDRGYDEVEALAVAKTKVALPGSSEHNLGLAADIVAEDYQKLDAGFDATPECQWLMAHCAEYGFILRYPKDKTAITGIQYEPWHYRYVGTDAAAEIQRQGVCLEEYLQGR